MKYHQKLTTLRKCAKEYAAKSLNLNPYYHEKFSQFGANIMAAKWDLIPDLYLSGFESAIVSNDLRSTFAKADDENAALIKYYVIMWNCMEFPKELQK